MEDALVLIFARNAFYRRQYQLALAALFLSLIVIIILTWIFVYLIKHPPKPLYFATDAVGRLLPEIPLSQPGMSRADVTTWAINAVQSTFSYDFINYRQQLQDTQKYYTRYGWIQYMKSLQASNNLIALTQRKMIIIAQVVEQPKLINEGILSGAYAWKFQMSLLVTYWLPPFNDKSKFFNPLQVTVIVQRQPLLKSYQGLGILQLIGNLVTTAPEQPLSATTG